ncbi:MAG: hypothetical protein AMJ45_00060 [Syntrophobacter sp. DG_60]|nr:MAG: hypothetical protein AMJ45_00060 [Syntrophobacter sp. DG_60]
MPHSENIAILNLLFQVFKISGLFPYCLQPKTRIDLSEAIRALYKGGYITLKISKKKRVV